MLIKSGTNYRNEIFRHFKIKENDHKVKNLNIWVSENTLPNSDLLKIPN